MPGVAMAPGIGQLIRSAAHVAECPFAVFYSRAEAGIEVAAAFGVGGTTAYDLGHTILEQAWAESAEDVFVVSDVRHQSEFEVGDVHLFGIERPPIRFLAAIRVTGQLDGPPTVPGLLVVADTHSHAGLSAATVFVLRTHAVQLALVQELHAMRHGEAQATPTDDGSAERLRLLEAVVVNATDAVLITQAEPIDEPGPVIVSCNTAFTRMTGYAEEDVIGRSPRMLQSPNTDRKALDRVRRALQQWEPVEVELVNRRKDGTDFWLELSIVPVANEVGAYTHWVSVQRDVTDRKIARDTGFRAGGPESLILQAEIRERRLAESRLQYAAFHDDLTRLRNRAYFMDRLGVALRNVSNNRGARGAMLFLDLDAFKLVNESLGYRAGDLMLMEVAHRLRACVRPADTLARLGGDEFALLIEGTAERVPALALARRIIEAMRAPFWLGKQEVFCAASIGIAVLSDRYDSPADVLRDAEIAMYKSKEVEPGSFTVFGAEMHDAAMAALQMQTDLRYAVARDEFFLEYQPICHANTRRIVGVEALVRWRHPDRGIVPPDEFITVAEENGLIRDIGRWVLREACAQMRVWQDRLPGLSVMITVNASGKELQQDGFVTETIGTLEAAGLRPDALQLEITETVFLTNPDAIGAVLRELWAQGVQIALDDFGTGYSSLSFIDRYPMNTIKIDRSFVERMLTQPRTMAIIRSIAQLGHGLDLSIVAEGIETEAQLAALQDAQCDFVQGYLLGKPVSADAMGVLLARFGGP